MSQQSLSCHVNRFKGMAEVAIFELVWKAQKLVQLGDFEDIADIRGDVQKLHGCCRALRDHPLAADEKSKPRAVDKCRCCKVEAQNTQVRPLLPFRHGRGCTALRVVIDKPMGKQEEHGLIRCIHNGT